MEQQTPSPQVTLHLIYFRAIDNRICLLLSNLGYTVRPVHNLQAFIKAFAGAGRDMMLVDAAADHEQGIKYVAEIASGLHQPLIITLCSNGSMEFCRRCFRAGAADVLDKSFNDEIITEALQEALGVISSMKAHSPSRFVHKTRFSLLSAREREVFHYLVEGRTSREIANILSLSPRTVECHRARLMDKLMVRNLAQLGRDYAHFLENEVW